jgi:hypothetical protein
VGPIASSQIFGFCQVSGFFLRIIFYQLWTRYSTTIGNIIQAVFVDYLAVSDDSVSEPPNFNGNLWSEDGFVLSVGQDCSASGIMDRLPDICYVMG